MTFWNFTDSEHTTSTNNNIIITNHCKYKATLHLALYRVISNTTNRLATEKALQQHVIIAAGNGSKHVRRFVAESALKSTWALSTFADRRLYRARLILGLQPRTHPTNPTNQSRSIHHTIWLSIEYNWPSYFSYNSRLFRLRFTMTVDVLFKFTIITDIYHHYNWR